VEVTLETVVRCTEIDSNGHVNNARYIEYLEWGREEWYDRQGLTVDRLRELGAVTVVVRIELNLKQPCHQGERLRIITWPARRGRTSFVMGQRIEKVGGDLVADALVTLVTVDPEGRRPRPLPEELSRQFPSGTDSR
jgi:YbgC/YbaW family acyl-CoA thioester hydrolase